MFYSRIVVNGIFLALFNVVPPSVYLGVQCYVVFFQRWIHVAIAVNRYAVMSDIIPMDNVTLTLRPSRN